MNYPHPLQVIPNDSYITIAVPTFCRPFYLTKLLDTLAEHADMPYEVVVHDDGSPKELQDQVYHMRNRISILSFNTGQNQGLTAAANHCISQASSKYVLFLNDDCFFTKPCLKDICNVLAHPYIGVVSPMNEPGPLAPHEKIVSNGTTWAVTNYLGGGSCIAFRKDVWQEVGGWDERSTSGQADNVFIYKILRAGYWKGIVEGKDSTKVGNFVYGDDYKPTQGYSKGIDCAFPKIFKIDPNRLAALGAKRREACQYWVDGERTIPDRHTYDNRPNPVAGLNDIPYWHHYFLRVFGNKNSHSVADINWEEANLHGQSKWKNQIIADYGTR